MTLEEDDVGGYHLLGDVDMSLQTWKNNIHER